MMGTTRGRIIECAWLLRGSFLGTARPTFWMDAINMGVLTPSILLSSPHSSRCLVGSILASLCHRLGVGFQPPLRSPFPSHPQGCDLHKIHNCETPDKGFDGSIVFHFHWRERTTRAMGGLVSRLRGVSWSSDPYYASYERALERIDGESRALEVREMTKEDERGERAPR